MSESYKKGSKFVELYRMKNWQSVKKCQFVLLGFRLQRFHACIHYSEADDNDTTSHNQLTASESILMLINYY